MTEKYYEVWFYQENGFASERMNKEDKDALYQVYEREFDD